MSFDGWFSGRVTNHRAQMALRYEQAERQGMVAATVFAPALAEARDCYVLGRYTAAVVLSQAVCEGVAKHVARQLSLAERFSTDDKKGPNSDGTEWQRASQEQRIQELRRVLGAEGAEACEALERVRLASRNDLVHMNRRAPANPRLARLASECVEDLFTIERYFFGLELADDGKVNLTRPQFWNADGGRVGLYLDLVS